MATVRQTLALQDKMSPVLSRIMSAMRSTLDVMEQVNVASSRGISASAFSGVRNEIASAERALDDFRGDLNLTEDATREVHKGFSGWQAAIVTANQAIGLVRSAVQGLGTVTNFFDSLSGVSSRVGLINDELQTQNELQQKIFESAQRSRANYQETASTIAKLNLLAGNVFGSNDESIAFAETLNKAFVISGADTSERSAALRQMTQAMASGRLQGDEYSSIIENAPLVAQAIEKYMGVSRGELKELASEGKITADIIKAAVFNASEEINTQFESMPKKFGDVMTSFKNNAIMQLAPIAERFNSLANSQAFSTGVDWASEKLGDIISWLDRMLGKLEEIGNNPGFQQFASQVGFALTAAAIAMGWLVEATVWFFNLAMSAWPVLGPVIYGVVGALIAYKTVTGLLALAELAKNAIFFVGLALSAAKTGLTLAEAAATMTDAEAKKYATAQQWALNSAMYAFPGMWIIMIILAVIVAIYMVVGAINMITGESISATGIILGALAVAGAFIWDLFLGIVDLVLGVINYLVNPILAFVNFFGNVFNDPIGSIVHLFADLADNILGVLESIAGALDSVFGSNMASTVAGWRSSLQAMAEVKAKEFGNGEYEKISSSLNLSSESLGLERIEYSDAWSAGYSAGETIDASVNGLMDKVFGGVDPEDFAATDYGSGFNPEDFGSTGNGLKVDASGSDVSLSDDDIKYLRDIAKLEYVNQYTTLRPVVQANFGDVRETVDVNQVIAVFEDAIEGAYESSLGKE